MEGKAKIEGHHLDPIEEIKRAQELILKKKEEVKTKLAKQLNDACSTFKLLQELGEKTVLQEPQFAEFCLVLGIGATTEKTVKKEKGKKGDIKETILSVLKKEGMNHGALKTTVEKILGREIANQYQSLDKMVEKKLLKKDKDGIYTLA